MIPYSKSAAVATLMTLTLAFSATASHARIAWTRSMKSAQIQAQKTGKPILIDFYTDWCGWCKKLDTDVYTNRRVQTLSRSFIMVKLNAEAEGVPYARHYRITGFPSMVFLNSKTEYLGVIPGYIDAGNMTSAMQGVLAKNKRTAVASTRTTRGKAKTKQSKLPDVGKVSSQVGYSGAYLLGDDGVVALDAPVAPKKSARR